MYVLNAGSETIVGFSLTPASLLRAFSDKLKAPADPAEGKNAAAVDAH